MTSGPRDAQSGVAFSDEANQRITYRPELDGLRAIAVLAVIGGHLSGWDAPGHAGVTAFFVLSGFLITGLVRPGELRGFYIRRVGRLAPALIVVLAFVAIAFGATAESGIIGSATYSSNWLMAEGVGLGPLQVTWSLAVEEQFYVLWPFLLIAWPRQAVRIAFVVIVVGIVLWMVLPYRVAYLSTPTNAAAIMVGALIALRGIHAARLLGAAGLAILFAGALSDAVALSVVGAALFITSGSLALTPLAPVGRRAYGLYLWHWPFRTCFSGRSASR